MGKESVLALQFHMKFVYKSMSDMMAMRMCCCTSASGVVPTELTDL